MTKRIKIVGGKAPKVRITSKLAENIDPNEIGSALGAERVSHVGADTASPTLQRLRVQLATALKSRGGRPGLEGAQQRLKVPMTADDVRRLETIAKRLADGELAPTAGQVASQLIHEALDSVSCELPRLQTLNEKSRERSLLDATRPVRHVQSIASNLPASVRKARRDHIEQAQEQLERAA